MSNMEHNETIYPTRSPPVSPTITVPSITGFTFDPTLSSISRANSFARIGSEMLPISLPHSHSLSAYPPTHSPYPPSTPSAQSPTHRRNPPPPIITSFSTNHSPMPTPVLNAFVTAGGATPMANNNMNNTNNINNKIPMDFRELSVVRWRAGHAFVIFGALLIVLGFCIGVMQSPTTTCKVPYMAYTYYDNYAPFASMECTTHSNGWYAGAPIMSIGALCVSFAWYYSWVKIQEMKMASKYHVAMV